MAPFKYSGTSYAKILIWHNCIIYCDQKHGTLSDVTGMKLNNSLLLNSPVVYSFPSTCFLTCPLLYYCVVPSTEGFFGLNLPPLWNFQFSCALSFKNFGIWDCPHPLHSEFAMTFHGVGMDVSWPRTAHFTVCIPFCSLDQYVSSCICLLDLLCHFLYLAI